MQIPYFTALHAFRAFAILNVVLLHTLGFVYYYVNNAPPTGTLLIMNNINEVLFHSGTIYFALISGCLFSMVLVDKGWRRFFTSKVLYVFCPYVVFSALFTWIHWGFDSAARQIFNGGLGAYLLELVGNLFTGEALFSFWYIPVLLVLYISTPVIYGLIRAKQIWAQTFVALLVLAPLVVSRTWPDMGANNFVYFIGVYTLGLLAGQHYRQLLILIARYWPIILSGVVVLSLILGWMHTKELDKVGFVSLRESLYYLQKIGLAALFILVFEQKLKVLPAWLNQIGKASFALYFIHAFFLFEGYQLLLNMGIQLHTPLAAFGFGWIAFFALLLLCLFIVYFCKKIFGRYSRSIVGA